MLEVRHLNAWWGQAQALFDVSFSVAKGELVVLQGLNGAGKSTLLQAIAGSGPEVSGELAYAAPEANDAPNSKPIDLLHLAAHHRARLGLGWVPEDRRLFAALTVQENLRIAARGNVAANEARCLDLFPALKSMFKRQAAHMSGGEQQMLAIARTLMTEPQLLLLDEPCEGIAPVLVEGIAAALLQLKDQGVTLLLAEQNQVLASRADRVLGLVAGVLG